MNQSAQQLASVFIRRGRYGYRHKSPDSPYPERPFSYLWHIGYNFEKLQPKSEAPITASIPEGLLVSLTASEIASLEAQIINSGRKGFLIGCSQSGNPYAHEPFHGLWDKGFTQAKYEYDGTFIAAGKAAFTAGLTLEDNPYRGGQKRALWMKGWWKAKHRADERARPKPLRFDTRATRFSSSKPNYSNPPKSRRDNGNR